MRTLYFKSAAALAAWALLTGVMTSCSKSSSPISPEQPVAFDIGANNPRLVAAFGDSISVGQDSTSGKGYRPILERLLAAAGHTGVRVVSESIGGTFARDGSERIKEVLQRTRPAVLLLMYGTNDQGKGLPQYLSQAELIPTSEHLRYIIRTARANKTLVVLATLPPVCSPGRQVQRANIISMNEKIRALGFELGVNDFGVMLADPWDDILAAAPPDGCDLISNVSNNHPNDKGYAVIAESFYNALKFVTW